MSKIIILVIIAEFLMTFGQICFKKSANRLNIEKTAEKLWIKQLLECVLFSPLLWMGAIAMLAGLSFWVGALTNGDLNFVCLLGSCEYIIALFAAHFLTSSLYRN